VSDSLAAKEFASIHLSTTAAPAAEAAVVLFFFKIQARFMNEHEIETYTRERWCQVYQ
jgi:hypothetical protein